MFILDWLGTLVTNILGFLLGYLSKNVLVITGGGIILMIPRILLRTQDGVKLAYVNLMNVLFWYAMLPELKEYLRLHGEGKLKDFQEASELIVLGEDGEIRRDKATPGSLEARLTRRFRRRIT